MLEITPNLKDDPKLPLYVQLYEYVKNDILVGKLEAGTRLPSIRKLAEHLNISLNTVNHAYQQLLAEGYVESKERSGLYIVELETDLIKSKKDIPDSTTTQKPSKKYTYDFRYGTTDADHFPFQTWRKLMNQFIQYNDDVHVTYGDAKGEYRLRKEIASYVHQSRGVRCHPDQIIMGSGLQHLLSLLAQLFRIQGRSKIAVENPCYDGARAVFQNHGYHINPISLNEDGISIEDLHKSRANIVYVTPSHQFPMGMVMSIKQRMKILQWAKEKDGIIIEDDYDSEFRYSGKPIPSLQGLDSHEKVVYLGTFSKSFLPSIRVGYMILTPSLLASYEKYFALYDQPVSTMTQHALATFMEEGHWERHIRKMRKVYEKKYRILLQAIHHFFDNRVNVIGMDSGLHILVEVHNGMSEEQLMQAAERKDVRVYPVSKHYASGMDDTPPYIQLGFGGMSEENIWEGIRILQQAWFEERSFA
ncbi:GntR family transcriptional regulator/MocR family aminotransferase [Salirhabdus euzebyi]|uniref:GntR family transcriptional regulator/MocR family aminotransferase n=1 Tax=Salirhabdus euzebyi TaxID=394506 RepID=A0A841Q4G9_9BACI|nr:PLP-dependent aminotransferase family protein [Salirhabdus euzebyi]MBB6453311.1 GntR family transcriptional regulator/MocR family aminotransferase [Salirhabdus euzebyi]